MYLTFLYGFVAFLLLLCIMDGKVTNTNTNIHQQERVFRQISSQKQSKLPKASKIQQQEVITGACVSSSCQCTVSHHKKNLPDLQQTIVWSKLSMRCSFFSHLRRFSRSTKSMVYDGASEVTENVETWNADTPLPYEVQDIVEDMTNDINDGNDYTPREKKAFDIFELVVNDEKPDHKVLSNCNGSEIETAVCFDDILDEDLKYVTRLNLYRVALTYFGTVDSPVLQIFPNLRRLKIRSLQDPRIFEVQLVDLFYLREFIVEADKTTIKLLCSFQCNLDNPKGFKLLRLESMHAGDIEVSDKLKLPTKINKLEIHEKVGNKMEIPVFRNVEFQNVLIDMDLSLRSDVLNIPDFSKSKINKEFLIRGHVQNVVKILPNIYEMGLQYPLKLELGDFFVYSVPFIEIKQSNLDDSHFDTNCLYGKKLLLHANESEYNFQLNKTHSKKLLIFRGLYLKLSDIEMRAKAWSNYAEIDEIRVYAYNIDVDIEPFIEGKFGLKYIINYVYIGTTTESIVGTKNHTMKRVMFYRDFYLQFIDMRNTREEDPIFMRALATCLIMNLGLHDEDASNKLQTDPLLSRWYQIIQNAKIFNPIIYAELERSRTQTAYKYLDEYITWSGNQNRDVARVPFLSLQVLGQNIHILAQAGRDIRDKSKHLKTFSSLEEIKTLQIQNLKTTIKSIADAKISILKASKAKSESLGDIELRKQNDLDKQLDDRQKLIHHLTTKFDEFTTEVETETVNFKNGVRLATALAVAEAAAAAVNGILSIFSGGFNPAKILKAAKKALTLAKLIKKLVKVMKTIASLIRNRKLMGTVFKKVRGAWKKMKPKISNFFQRQKTMLSDWFENKQTVLNKLETKDLKRYKKFVDGIKIGGKALDNTKSMVENTVSFSKAERTVRMGYDPGNPTEGVTFGDEKLATVKEAIDEFKDRLAQGVAKQGKKLSAVDVFKWTIAREHVTGMIDTTLSDDVPEATNYRTALLKLITTGETRTQASLDEATLETSFCLSRHAWALYFIESVSIAQEIAKTETDLKKQTSDVSEEVKLRKWAAKKRSEADMDVEWEILSIKLELVRLNEEFCNAYYYFHLEKCQEDLRINPSDDLEKVLSLQNMLLYQSNQKLRDLYPPPQTFTDRSILIKKPKHCQCLHNFQDFHLTSTTTKDERNRLKNDRHADAKECLELDSVVYPLRKNDETDEQMLARHHNITNHIMKKCTNNTIANVIKDNEFIYKVDIDSSYFSKHERVRIDEVKAIFKGVKTSNGILEIYAESTGVYEDRYHSKCYKFIGEKWIRTLSYYTKSALIPKRNEIVRQDLDAKLDQIIEGQKQLIMEVNKLKGQRDNEITFIDSGDIHKGFEGVFTAPTAFTTWTFTIPTNRNPGLDLAGLSEIELKFTGNFVTSGASNSVLQCKVTDDDSSDQSTVTTHPY